MAPLALVLAGCMDFVPASGPEAERPTAFLTLEHLNPGPGTAPDTLAVRGFVQRAAGVRLADDTLRVAGRAIGARPLQGVWAYEDTLLLAPGSLGQTVHVRLPVPAGAPFALQEFQYLGVARRGPDVLTVRPGADVVLPIEAGGGTLGIVSHEYWAVSMFRGQANAEIRTSSAPPATLVLPASLVPADTASTMFVELRSTRAFTAEGAAPVYLSTSAVLRWRVHIAP